MVLVEVARERGGKKEEEKEGVGTEGGGKKEEEIVDKNVVEKRELGNFLGKNKINKDSTRSYK